MPPNTLAELRRDMARLRFVMEQITEIEQARLDRIAQGPEEGMHAMVRVLSGVKGIGVETADMLGMAVRTVVYKFPQALDRLTQLLLDAGLLLP